MSSLIPPLVTHSWNNISEHELNGEWELINVTSFAVISFSRFELFLNFGHLCIWVICSILSQYFLVIANNAQTTSCWNETHWPTVYGSRMLLSAEKKKKMMNNTIGFSLNYDVCWHPYLSRRKSNNEPRNQNWPVTIHVHNIILSYYHVLVTFHRSCHYIFYNIQTKILQKDPK